uniref:Uncharacterized protein n=1 Tax=Aegilops tauschii subsp. strangulata TaxID=200361 RepID=A0A453LTJ9_AEGTS
RRHCGGIKGAESSRRLPTPPTRPNPIGQPPATRTNPAAAMGREPRINTAPRGNRAPLLDHGETARVPSDLEEGSNVQAANVGFCRVIKLAKPDAWKLIFATTALLVASLSNLLVPKYGGKIIDIVSRDVRRPEDRAQALADVNGTILYIVMIVVTG